MLTPVNTLWVPPDIPAPATPSTHNSAATSGMSRNRASSIAPPPARHHTPGPQTRSASVAPLPAPAPFSGPSHTTGTADTSPLNTRSEAPGFRPIRQTSWASVGHTAGPSSVRGQPNFSRPPTPLNSARPSASPIVTPQATPAFLPPKPTWGATPYVPSPHPPGHSSSRLPFPPSGPSQASQLTQYRTPNGISSDEVAVYATLLTSPSPEKPKPEEGPAIPGKRKRDPSPFEWMPELAAEPEPDGYLELGIARSVELDVQPRVQSTFLPLPLPSKRAKTKAGSRAVLIPVERLPVFPLPPLPPIQDDQLVKQVFTHSSLFERENRLFEYPDAKPARHYEKLEHVGDSILGMVVTTWLHELQPQLTCGTATKLKAHLVSNATLSHISGMYNFPQRLNGDPRLLPVLRAQTDVRAALVEAYIAALYFSYPPDSRPSDGLAVVSAWLREMLDPLYDFFLTFMRTEHRQHNSAMGAGVDGVLEVASSPEALDKLDEAAEGMALLINTWGKVRERRIEWDCERYLTGVGELWRMRLSVDGVEMGDAIRAYIQRAKNAAGLQAARKLGLAESI